MNAIKPKRYWKNLDTIIAEAKKVIDEIGCLPCQNELTRIGKGGLATAISEYGGGYLKIRKLLGIKGRKPNGYWDDEKIFVELKKIKEEKGYLPSSVKLRDMKRNDLNVAISRNGGYRKFKDLLGIKETKKIDGYWTVDNTLTEAKKIVNDLGYLPAQGELWKDGKSTLALNIGKYGGFGKFRKLLGLDETRKPEGYWNLKNTLAECRALIEEKGYLPSAKELIKIKKSSLITSINKHGGYYKIRETLGLPLLRTSNHLEKAVQEYVQ